MSWDADLIVDDVVERTWNYTHNTSCMIRGALDDQGYQLPPDPARPGPMPWWVHLDGMDGPAGAAYLGTILAGLRADPERFREMNPPNGWGDYDSLVEVLDDMHRSVPERRCRWEADG